MARIRFCRKLPKGRSCSFVGCRIRQFNGKDEQVMRYQRTPMKARVLGVTLFTLVPGASISQGLDTRNDCYGT